MTTRWRSVQDAEKANKTGGVASVAMPFISAKVRMPGLLAANQNILSP